MALRISKTEKAELKRLQRNAKAKVRRLEKKGVDVGTLPLINFNQPTTRQELNAMKNEAKSFLNRANLNYQYDYSGAFPISKKKVMQIESMQKEANRLLSEKERMLSQPKKLVSEIKQEIPNTSTIQKPRNIPKFKRKTESFKNEDDLQNYISALEKSIENNKSAKYEKIFMENMQTALVTVFGDKGEELAEKVSKMGLENVLDMYYMTDIFNIEFIYEEEDYERKLAYVEYMIEFYSDIVSG